MTLPTPEQFHGTRHSSVDITRGPPLPCPKGLKPSLYKCIDLWVDGNGGPAWSPCTGCRLGAERRQGIAPPLDGPDLPEADEQAEVHIRRWSSQDLTRALELFRGGTSVAAAAAATGVPEDRIRNKLVQACLKPGRRAR